MKKADDLQKYIVDFLNGQGWRVWRNNSGTIKTGDYYVRLSPKGTGDIIGRTNDGRYVHVEVKIDDDKLSSEQIDELIAISASRYGVAGVVKTKEDFEDWYTHLLNDVL